MHVNFKHITIHNFMSFGHAELSFTDLGFVRVTGINENPSDNAVSNGSGKSSLWEALVWAITGETIRGSKQIMNIYGEDGCFVDLDFCIDSTQYKLIRSKEHKVYKTNLQIFIDGQDASGKGIRDSDKLLQQYLPELTSSLIGSVIVLGQGLPQKFTNNTPSGRKEVLEKLSKSDFMIEDLKEKVSKRKTELTRELRGYEDAILAAESKKSFLQTQTTQQIELLNTLNETELKNKESLLCSELQILEQSTADIDKRVETLFSSKEDILTRRGQIVNNENEQLSELYNMFQDKTMHLYEAKSKLTAELAVAKTQLSSILNIKDVCPTCGQKLLGVHKPDTKELEATIDLCENNLTELTTQLTNFENHYQEDCSSTKKSFLDSKSSIDQEYKDICNSYDSARVEKQKYKTQLDVIKKDLSATETQLAQLQATTNTCNKIIHDNNVELAAIEETLSLNNRLKDTTQQHLDVINKFDTVLKRDFRGYLLSSIIECIETRAKEYCNIIFETTDIRFCLNGNNIDITYMNKSYENLSGGEKQKVDLIIQFSIRDLLQSQSNFTSNILVLDEVFDGLDMIGCQRVIDVITNLNDIKNIFIVTHRKDLSIPADNEIVITKNSKGISSL